MNIRVTALYLLGIACCLCAALHGREAQYEFVVQSNVSVAMRDGVNLATDIYLPANEGRAAAGKFPVILTRTPYNKNGNARFGRYYAERGYVFIAQDTRGRYASDGVWHWMTDDGPDGWDCAAWIGRQSWFD